MEKSNFELSFIKSSYIAEVIAATGSEELMAKENRPYVGMYDTATGWFVPLRSNLRKTQPEIAHWATPFETNNPHYKNPGLDFQKAIFVPNENDVEIIKNTLPTAQWDYIAQHSRDINSAFTDYVLWVDQVEDDNFDKKWSTVPLFPEGIQSIRERIIAEEIEIDQSINNDMSI